MTGKPPDDAVDYASTAAVSGLAREVDALRRVVEPVALRVEELAGLVAAWGEATAGAAAPEPAAVPSWLDLPYDVGTAQALLDELTSWMARVYLRYPDAAQSLPDCWLWHPAVIEELLWLMHAWAAAYAGDTASVQLVGDWHDRYRPGVTRRINSAAGRCSLENHQDPDPLTDAPTVPVTNAVELIANWWADNSRAQPAPEPGPDHLAAATGRHRPGGRR